MHETLIYDTSTIKIIFRSQYPDLKKFDLRYFEGGSNLIFYAHSPSAPDSYVLKVIPNYKRYDFKIIDFDFMYSCKQYLANQSTAISKIYCNKDNKLFSKVIMNGIEWFYSLHYYTPGYIHFPITPKISGNVGKQLAIFHNKGLLFKHENKRTYFTKSNLIEKPLEIIYQNQHILDNYEFLVMYGKLLHSEFNEIIDQDHKYIIHGDFWHGNIIIDFLPKFIDFDFVTYGIPEMDIASMKLLGLQHGIQDKMLLQSVTRMVQSTIEGYNSMGKYQLDNRLINELAKIRAFWTISAYLNSFGYLSNDYICQKINKTVEVLNYLVSSQNDGSKEGI